ncbi:FAD-dependent oxidoreductase [Aquibacillus halophilus]|uniref:Glycerol-3-phosphate dehydrogenase n=1 Tax=Aquibacillus halophilus TaxID=930132 RepID=A0A6A8DDY8_9BACI|nr:glycerol-3-phosphate dehydrogenase/oxidase [Aquibacillus halophilus]MRH43908.1 FAD-dependent oxidoreductase [Aquibacillus halophilus]
MAFSSLQRKEIYEKMSNQTNDLIVIGGGITGAGIALDAANRGMKVTLVDMQDFAAGTSSRSTKLVHGGLRYLKQFEVKMVAEVGKERAIVYENGPHVTTPEWMMLPFYKGGTFGPFSTNIGLRVYDFLAGVKKIERRKMFSKEEAMEREPLLKENNLKGAGFYVEYKTDDARLTLEVMKKAVEKGALALNYAKVEQMIYENGKVIGVEVEDQIDQTKRSIYSKNIVNAAGPWVDKLREKDHSKKGKRLRLTKGIHLVFDGERFPLKQALYFDTPDRRMVFAIPREGKTYVGTTDTVYEGNIAHPTMTEADRDYVLNAIKLMFPHLTIGVEDVESSWAGLRPLIYEEGKDPSEISRKDEIFISDSGFISIAGGKLTGYRKMAESIINLITKNLKKTEDITYSYVSTKHLPISGGDVGGSQGFKIFIADKVAEAKKNGISETDAKLLIQRYGSNISRIYEIYQNEKEQAKEVQLDLLLYAKVRYAIDYELCYKPVDFFIRRTGALFFDIDWVRMNKDSVISYMTKRLNWSDQQIKDYVDELDTLLYEANNPVPEYKDLGHTITL